MFMFATPIGSQNTARFYPRTASGVIEIKTIPESRILVTGEDGSYFDESNRLFGRLFNYIKSHDIPMTAPVEGSLDEDARMIFYVGPNVQEEGLTDEGDVRVLRLKERTVAAIGGRGSYREKNVRRYQEKLEQYLASQDINQPAGPAYTVFWNPPFIPWFLRHLEVHIPVQSTKKDSGD